MNKLKLLGCVSLMSLMAAHASAQEQQSAAAGQPTSAIEQVVVTGIIFRDRTEAVSPELSYDREYFQRFEPLTAGDAMKRVPSVQFLSDVLESDGARLRGLDSGYTQILINGERVPGGGVDRSFFVDRIPAELIERVEVKRSNSANRSGDAMAGALNIVLRDAYALDGGYLRAGAILLNDNHVRETVGGVFGTQVGPGRILLGANMQGRRNPKLKRSLRYDEPGGTLDNIEVQTDTRNGTDYSANAGYTLPLSHGEFELSGFFVRTDRFADEDSLEYLGGAEIASQLDLSNDNNVDIRQDNWSVNGRFTTDLLGGTTRVKFNYAAYSDDNSEVEEEFEFLRDAIPSPEDDRFTGDLTLTDLKDEELGAQLEHAREFGMATAEVGLHFNKKNRDTSITTDRNRVDIPNAPGPRPTIPGTYGPFVPVDGGVNSIEETRLDPYLMFSGNAGMVKWEVGVRYETTDVRIVDETAPAVDRISDVDYNTLLPSAHLRWSLTPSSRINLSVARSVHRPNFNDISPAVLLAEKGDNDFVGNPDLKPEKAWGFDAG